MSDVTPVPARITFRATVVRLGVIESTTAAFTLRFSPVLVGPPGPRGVQGLPADTAQTIADIDASLPDFSLLFENRLI